MENLLFFICAASVFFCFLLFCFYATLLVKGMLKRNPNDLIAGLAMAYLLLSGLFGLNYKLGHILKPLPLSAAFIWMREG